MTDSQAWMIVQDPEYFSLMTTDLKLRMIKAAIDTVNIQAALTRKNAIKNIQNDFVLRNTFTTRQVLYEVMPQQQFVSLSSIKSTVGITEKADYMLRQEYGGVRRNKDNKNLAIPTDRARGGNKGSPVQKGFHLSKMERLKKIERPEGYSYKAWLVRNAAIAQKRKYLVMFYNKKFFQVTDFVKTGDNVSFKMNMIYNMSLKETVTPARPWMAPAMEQPARDGGKIFISQMRKQPR